MNLIKIYKGYRSQGVNELESLGATALQICYAHSKDEMAELSSYVINDISKNIKKDKTFEEDINETDKTSEFKTA